ncbi:hypothetical protein AWC05_17285 [Mycobacterium florentinum]|uniref:Uncharacterized protein n=1 Tax=Mycobacterium florentinum TaxID=292462 RepID=A0A1X1UC98_MYCFL|nr:hypothetical protein AWC05_17285 [Mycobacterium florentinum]
MTVQMRRSLSELCRTAVSGRTPSVPNAPSVPTVTGRIQKLLLSGVTTPARSSSALTVVQ